jgi:hypothetical protein
MQVLEIKDISRKDVPIYYRMFYMGCAILEVLSKTVEAKVDFSLETKPTGAKEVVVTLIDNVDYPLAPLATELRKKILELEDAGRLPR